MTELNENLRDIYIEAYTSPVVLKLINVETTKELQKLFGSKFPGYTESDFYELDVGTSGLMRGYMCRPCDMYFTLERKLQRFLEASLRVYRVDEEEIARICAFVAELDMRAVGNKVIQDVFAMLEMKYDFKLSE